MYDEHVFYNAVAVALEGDRRRIAKLKAKFFGWERAFRKLYTQNLFPELAPKPDPGREWEKLEAAGVSLILSDDSAYPAPLREIPHPPLGIYVRCAPGAPGYPSLSPSHTNAIAIVGTRRATPEGKSTARAFARELADAGFVIVSGLAFGIDAAGHEGCLETAYGQGGGSGGKTVAVLAGGLDSVYPRNHARLAERILECGGAVVSEYPLGSPPLSYRFIERNRIISGLSRGVLLIEAPDGSGSLATARFALEQNRDVFVVPGAITHPNFFGSHQLIRQGAELVTSAQEILEAYDVAPRKQRPLFENAASREEKLILKALQDASGPQDVDKLVSMTTLEPRAVNRALSFLLLKNYIKELDSGYIIE